MALSIYAVNRLGFVVLGLTNNFAYVIMLSAAFDLLKDKVTTLNESNHATVDANYSNHTLNRSNSSTTLPPSLGAPNATTNTTSYCNEHSTSTILLADTLPSLVTKIVYPILLVNVLSTRKAIATALFTAVAFIITGLSTSQALIFTGVACASLSSGLGESTFLSNTPQYGDVSLSGWSIGTGGAGVLGAASYALMAMFLPIGAIMLIMLVVPLAMLVAYFFIIQPIEYDRAQIGTVVNSIRDTNGTSSRSTDEEPIDVGQGRRGYGANDPFSNEAPRHETSIDGPNSPEFTFDHKIKYLPNLAKYFLPLLVVYMAEYFINQGLFELVYYPEIKYLDHGAQYRWFQVSYQVGVMFSRSSLEFFRIKSLWTMSLLQVLNAFIFLAHAGKVIHIPNFYLAIALVVYEGLLGGFTYVNTFFRVKKEVPAERREFAISTVTIADSLGIVMAAILALPTHNELCKLYT